MNLKGTSLKRQIIFQPSNFVFQVLESAARPSWQSRLLVFSAQVPGRFDQEPWPVPWTSFPWCCWRWAPGCWAAWRAKVASSWTLPLQEEARWPCVASRMTSMPGRRLWAQKIRHCCWSRLRMHLGQDMEKFWQTFGDACLCGRDDFLETCEVLPVPQFVFLGSMDESIHPFNSGVQQEVPWLRRLQGKRGRG